ncbi:MAG TPA: hypothetical protein VJT75_16190 [Thermoleophilaceae bacterium]|nr:hypothetical protein [Thermoleophilaceae bacterium]
MRSFVLAIALACACLALLAPAASANEFQFVASDGRTCTLEHSQRSTLLADGNWDVWWIARMSCTKPASYARILTYIELPNHSMLAPQADSDTCGGRRPCGWTLQSSGVMRDVPGDVYKQTTSVEISLPSPATALDPPLVWVAAPVGCLPGDRSIGCWVSEDFKPQ